MSREKIIYIRMPAQLRAILASMAKKNYRSISDEINYCLDTFLNRTNDGNTKPDLPGTATKISA